MHRTQQSMVFLFALGLGLFVTPGVAQEARQSDQPVSITAQALVLKNVWLIDGTGAPATGNAWVRIEGDRITAVGTGTPAPIAGARIMDLEGRTVLPGLIDTHVHLRDLEQARWMLKLLLAHGVTTVKDAGNSLDNIVNIRLWMRFKAAVPRLFISGTVLAGPPGEMQFLSEGDRTAARVRDNIAFGVDVIKVHNWVSSQALRQIVSLAEANSLDVVGHIPLSMTSIAAIDAGMKIVMHASTLRASELLDDPELVARYPIDLPYPLRWGYWAHFEPVSATLQRTLAAWEKRKEDFFFEPTLAVLEGMASTHDLEVRENKELQRLVSPRWRTVWHDTVPGERGGAKLSQDQIVEAKAAVANMAVFVGLAHGRGIRIITGTDSAGGPPWVVAGDSLHRELELFVQAGLSPVEAIRSATGTAAEALIAPDRGTIRVGKLADLVIVRGNLAKNIAAIREIEQVMLNGVLYERAQLLEEASRWALEQQ